MRLQGYLKPNELIQRKAYILEALECCRAVQSPIWEASCLRNLAEIARLQGDVTRAEALEAEADRVDPEPERDPAVEAALEQAFNSKDVSKMMEALQQALGDKKEKD